MRQFGDIFYVVVDPRILKSMLVLSLALEKCAQLMLQLLGRGGCPGWKSEHYFFEPLASDSHLPAVSAFPQKSFCGPSMVKSSSLSRARGGGDAGSLTSRCCVIPIKCTRSGIWRNTCHSHLVRSTTTTHLTSHQRTTPQHSTAQHSTAQHNTTQHNTTQHNTTQRNITHTDLTTLHHTTPHYRTPHHTTPHNTAQHSTTPHEFRRSQENLRKKITLKRCTRSMGWRRPVAATQETCPDPVHAATGEQWQKHGPFLRRGCCLVLPITAE